MHLSGVITLTIVRPNLKNSHMKLTAMQKTQGKWQRSFTRDKVARCAWLTKNDKNFLNAIFDRRHMRHKSQCKPGCEPGWAKIPMKDLKKTASLGQAALNETIERLVKKDVVKRESEGLYPGRDGATRYRIISLPAYEPANSSHEEEGAELKQGSVVPTKAPALRSKPNQASDLKARTTSTLNELPPDRKSVV